MELPGNVYWEAGNVNSNTDTGHVDWRSGDVNSNSSNNDHCSNSKPGLLPTPDKLRGHPDAMYGGRQQFGGRYGVGGGQGGMGGVDQAQLVNTLVNVATNILTGAGHQGGQQGGLGGAGQGQGGILGSGPRGQQSSGYHGGASQAGYVIGVGGVGNGSQQQGRVWAGQEEERWPSSTRGSHTGVKMTAKDFNEKNYRPKIKVEGMPPNYFNGDFEHLNSKHFSCINCDKRNMWDAESFVKHLRGQKHVNKIEELIKEDQAAVAALRAQMKVKAGKVTGPSKKCAMCDIEVAGKGTDSMNSHRRTTEHQTLKRFIHPHCDYCRADFEDRTDWHYHRLSAEHLTNSE